MPTLTQRSAMMKNLSAHTAQTVPRKRWISAVCAAAVFVAISMMATSALAQFGYEPYTPQIPVFQDTLWVMKGAAADGDGSSQHPFGTIQETCDTINNRYGVEAYLILVGPGTYEENVYMPSYTTTWIRSLDGPGTTKIVGQGFAAVSYESYTGAQLFSGIQGFTIADNSVHNCEGSCDGAITASAIYGVDQFFILDNWIENNSSSYGAGAISIGYGVEAFIIGNHIIGNTSTYSSGYDFSAGAIDYEGAYGVISNNIIAENTGETVGGIFAYSDTYVIVSNNTFADNTFGAGTGGAGAVYLHQIPGFRETGKVTDQQLALLHFDNNIVAFNSGPAMNADYPSETGPRNCLFYDNGGDGTSIGVHHFTVNIPSGFNNIFDEDPLFADREARDYHITCGSPARDVGDNDLVPPDFLTMASDIDGPPQNRIGPYLPGIMPIVDIGADEFWDTHKIAAFSTPDTVGCAPLTVHFTNESECLDEEWRWFFGDAPLFVGEKNPTHVYTDTGLYTVQLDAVGDLDTATTIKTNYIRVLPPLTIDFDGDSLAGCGSVTTLFTATATADVDSFLWVFGDGDSAVSLTDTLTHDYGTVGIFSVTLVAFNPCGQVTIIKPNYVTTISGAEVELLATFDEPLCAPAEVTFSYVTDQPLTNIVWLFGDDSSSTDANPTHLYEEAGAFAVSLTATSECGDVSVDLADPITVLGAPDVAVSAVPTGGCAGLTEIAFGATITGDADSSRWFFNDGATALGPNASHTYAAEGSYQPFVIVYHPCGETQFGLSNPVDVTPPPVAAFSASPLVLYETESVEFTDLSDGPVTSYQWNFGDGAQATTPNPVHAYAPGIYTVALQITNGCGSDTETKPNYIRVGSFKVTCDSTGTSGGQILYTVDVDSLVIAYDHTVVLTAELLGSPLRGSVDFAFDQPSGVPPFTTILRATPKGGLSSGNYTIRVTADDALRMAKTDLCPLHYTATRLISTPASPLAFGNVIIDTDSIRSVVITNTAGAGSGATLNISSPSVTGSAFSIDGAGGILQPGGTLTWHVTFMPTQVQSYTGTLHIVSDDPVAPSIDVSLTGSGIPVPDLTPPCVASTNPAQGAEIAIDSVIRITFTEGMVPSSGVFQVFSASLHRSVSGTTVWETTRRVKFTPDIFLPPDDDISVLTRGTVADSAGNTLDGDCNGTAAGTPADDFSFEFTTGPGVFPGDTDNDGFVNEGDVIPIGRFWHLHGPARTNPQDGFTIQPATAWTPRAATYADADGGGTVDSLDICPVIDYFDQPTGLARHSVDAWVKAAQGWSDDVVSALIAALDICTGEGPGRAAISQFLHSLQTTTEAVPNDYSLGQNYPNPFNPTTIIAYRLRQDAHVRIEVFDIQGRLVRVLEDKFQTAGQHSVLWDSHDDNDRAVASGIYFYRMTTPDFRFSRKMVLVR